MRLRTTVLVTPENLDSALGTLCDAVLFDLADETRDGPTGRIWASVGLGRVLEAGKRGLVRVNHPRSGLLRDDLAGVVGGPLDAVVLPHVTEAQDVRDTAVALREFELARGIEPGAIGLFATIDTARGLLRAADIMFAAPRVRGLVFDTHRYALDIGARSEEWGPRLAYARGHVIAVARAHDALPLCVNDGTELRQLANYGFAGILLPGPGAVLAAATAFTPPGATRDRAQSVIEAFEAARASGQTVARFHSTVIDGHTVRKARQTLE